MTIFDQLRRDEGLELKPYRDTSVMIGFEGKVGKLTIGIGRNLDDVGVSEAEANYMLGNDVAKVTSVLRQKLPWVDDLNEARFAVLQNLAFNIGVGSVLKFIQMLSKLQQERFEEAATELQDSLWFHQTGDRAKRLVRQLQLGEWS